MSRFVSLCRVMLMGFSLCIVLEKEGEATTAQRAARGFQDKIDALTREIESLKAQGANSQQQQQAEINRLEAALTLEKEQNILERQRLEAERDQLSAELSALRPQGAADDGMLLGNAITRLAGAGVDVMNPIMMMRILAASRSKDFDAITPAILHDTNFSAVSNQIIFSDPDMGELRDQHRMLLKQCIDQLEDFVAKHR